MPQPGHELLSSVVAVAWAWNYRRAWSGGSVGVRAHVSSAHISTWNHYYCMLLLPELTYRKLIPEYKIFNLQFSKRAEWFKSVLWARRSVRALISCVVGWILDGEAWKLICAFHIETSNIQNLAARSRSATFNYRHCSIEVPREWHPLENSFLILVKLFRDQELTFFKLKTVFQVPLVCSHESLDSVRQSLSV